jgi:general secretion pathway protein J
LRARGFTLVELLVALALLAVLAVLSLRGLSSMLDAESHVRGDTQRWSTVSMVMSQLGHDLSLASARPEIGAGGELVIARYGDSDVAPVQSGPQTVFYGLKNGTLEYRVRAVASPVLENVAAFELRALGPDGTWGDLAKPAALPRAVEAQIVLAGGERITRVFLLR